MLTLTPSFETITLHLASSIKRGAAPEVAAAAELLSVVLCTVPVKEALFEEFFPLLSQVANDDKKPEASRVAVRRCARVALPHPFLRQRARADAQVVQTLAMLFFVHGPPERLNEVLNIFVHIYRHTRISDAGAGTELIEEALLAWALVASTMHVVCLAAV